VCCVLCAVCCVLCAVCCVLGTPQQYKALYLLKGSGKRSGGVPLLRLMAPQRRHQLGGCPLLGQSPGVGEGAA
jgi:hypothetical protein